MGQVSEAHEAVLRRALEGKGQRFTEQRAAVYGYLAHTSSHPTADDVFLSVRHQMPGISLATVYKSLETLVGCGLAGKLTYSDGSARYDGRTDPHHHVRCVVCGSVADIPGHLPQEELDDLRQDAHGFRITGYRLELTGYCVDCEAGSQGATPSV